MKQDIKITRIFNNSVEEVWDAWKNPLLVKQWWGPDKFICTFVKMDFREGGMSLVSMASPELGFAEQFNSWRYIKIIPLESIEFVSNLSDENGDTIEPAQIGMPRDFPKGVHHIVSFKKLSENQTEVTVIEKDWPMTQMRKLSEMGMNQCLDKMAKALV
ncbi:SRPBCC family protein [Sulfurimonas sp.]|uniref:SRPBCC family protein n=1 Tax=Sulfurimonas sp. TaxID=2022749 RepID=UPI003D09906E